MPRLNRHQKRLLELSEWQPLFETECPILDKNGRSMSKSMPEMIATWDLLIFVTNERPRAEYLTNGGKEKIWTRSRTSEHPFSLNLPIFYYNIWTLIHMNDHSYIHHIWTHTLSRLLHIRCSSAVKSGVHPLCIRSQIWNASVAHPLCIPAIYISICYILLTWSRAFLFKIWNKICSDLADKENFHICLIYLIALYRRIRHDKHITHINIYVTLITSYRPE